MENFEFFGEVALAFTHTATRKQDFYNHIDDIMSFLRKHNHQTINKQCITKLILKLDTTNTQNFQDIIQAEAFELIGDPAIDAYWSPWEGASESDEQELRRAQTILNEWITRKCIGLFFERLAMDADRKKFWLRYVKKITKFKIYLSNKGIYLLKIDNRLDSYLQNRLGRLDGAESALVMILDNYTLIEFSTTGHAFYAYKSTNPLCPKIERDYVSVYDLKHPQSMKALMSVESGNLYNFQPEGKLNHSGHWQWRLEQWLKKFLGI
jgi:hypothetical protein